MFGDRGLLLVGDLLQIPPVMAKPIFSEPKTTQNMSLWNSNANLWDACETVELLENKRTGVSQWTNILNRFRTGEQTTADEMFLEQRNLTKFKKSFDDALHLFFTNKEVFAYNQRILNDVKGKAVKMTANITGIVYVIQGFWFWIIII